MVKEDCKLHVFTCIHVFYIMKVRGGNKNYFSRTNLKSIYIITWTENGHSTSPTYDIVQFSRIRMPVRFTYTFRFQSQKIASKTTKNSKIIGIAQRNSTTSALYRRLKTFKIKLMIIRDFLISGHTIIIIN